MIKVPLKITITARNGEYLYSVWHPHKGFVASGWRKTESEVRKAIKVVVKGTHK
jgi:hypothetical protein